MATTSMDYLDHAMLHSSYKNAINPTCALHSCKNLTNQFATLATENEDLILEYDAAIIDCNALTMWVMQLEAQLIQTLTLMTAATISLPTGHKG
jgi:hypothetical protein